MSNIRLGALASLLVHAEGLLNALRVGSTVTISAETLDAIKRDPNRMRDLHHHAMALEDYVRELRAQKLSVTSEAPAVVKTRPRR